MTERGALSIDVFGLNRPRLIENRALFLETAFEKIEAYLSEGKNASKFLQYNGQLLPSYYPYLACLHSNMAQKYAGEPETLLNLARVLPGGLEVPNEVDSISAEESAAYYRDTLQSKEVEKIIKSRGLKTEEQSSQAQQELLEEVLEQQRKKHHSSYSLDELDSAEDKNIKDLFNIFGIPPELSAMGVKKA